MTTLASKPDYESHNNPLAATDNAPPEVIISDNRLHELGYQTTFRREMSLFGVLGISFCAIGILTGMSSAFQTGLFSGGPLGLFWGWNVCLRCPILSRVYTNQGISKDLQFLHAFDCPVSGGDLQCIVSPEVATLIVELTIVLTALLREDYTSGCAS